MLIQLLSLPKKAVRYWRKYGTQAFIQRIIVRLGGVDGQGQPALPKGPVQARYLIDTRFTQCNAIRVFSVPRAALERVTLVTDSISSGSFYGGVATAIILAVKLVESRGARLRILLRVHEAEAANLAKLLALHKLALTHEVEFAFVHYNDEHTEIDVFPGELFLTTSWWTTSAMMGSVSPADIVYLLQEDERMFYPHGDDHLRCTAVLSNPKLRFVVNTRMLLEHFKQTGLPNVAERGMSFEPAFPAEVFFPRARAAGEKRRFVFYARPNNLRNLFYTGIELIDDAVRTGLLDPATWDIVLVGKDIPHVVFGDGYQPKVLENLGWQDYATLIGQADLGLSLMYTPHPSYPPLDLAASGAVVVSNRFGLKQDLAPYCANILCSELDRDAMRQALAEGVRLALADEERRRNYEGNRLQRDWHTSFAEVLRFVGEAA